MTQDEYDREEIRALERRIRSSERAFGEGRLVGDPARHSRRLEEERRELERLQVRVSDREKE